VAGWVGFVVPGLLLAAVALGWRYWWPDSFEGQIVTRVRSWWRWRRVYQARWRQVMIGCGLVVTTPAGRQVPRVTTIQSRPDRDRLTLLLPAGQVPDDVIEASSALAHGLRAFRVSARDLGYGQVQVTVWRGDPIAAPIVPVALPHAVLLRDDITAEEVIRRLSRLVVGRTEDGEPWRVSVKPGAHMLAIGTTGAGKSSLLWAIIWQLADLIVSGWVQVHAFDPKVIELRDMATSGLATVHTDMTTMPAQLTQEANELKARFSAQLGRDHVPSPACPVRLVIVDELAVLTALTTDTKAVKEVGTALGTLQSMGRAGGYQVIVTSVEATKEVVRWRGLCDSRICYRTSEPASDLAFGEGAHDRGVRTELIPRSMPGVAYADTGAGVIRVRTLHITDDHIAALSDAVRAALSAAPGGSDVPAEGGGDHRVAETARTTASAH
jgi:DNA segregation ATPase FtsK/SpoIIIE, S-DNA-T family